MTLPEGVSTYAAQIDDMFRLILWITGIIFVVVEALLLFFLFRYRHREGRRPHYTHGNNRLEVIWTIVPAVICVVLALLSRAHLGRHQAAHAARTRIADRDHGEQFAWNIRYPGADGKFGTADDILTLEPAPLPGRQAGRRDAALEGRHPLVLPARVPGQAGRGAGHVDAHLVRGDAGGHWEIACAELCGLGHYRMKGFVTVETPEEFAEVAGRSRRAAAARPEQPSGWPDRRARGRGEPPRRRPPRSRGRQEGTHEHASPSPTSSAPGVHAAPTSFWRKYIFSLDHKVIGKQYLFYALFMLVIGGLLATLVR